MLQLQLQWRQCFLTRHMLIPRAEIKQERSSNIELRRSNSSGCKNLHKTVTVQRFMRDVTFVQDQHESASASFHERQQIRMESLAVPI